MGELSGWNENESSNLMAWGQKVSLSLLGRGINISVTVFRTLLLRPHSNSLCVWRLAGLNL